MRRISAVLGLVLAAGLVPAGAGPATAATADGEPPTLRLAASTTRMYMYDTSEQGTGPFHPAAGVRAALRNCPQDGMFLVDATLVQGGRSARWASGSALGAQERSCSEGAVTRFDVAFFDAELRPGRAVAEFQVKDWATGEVLATAKRVVRLPRWATTCPRGARPVR